MEEEYKRKLKMENEMSQAMIDEINQNFDRDINLRMSYRSRLENKFSEEIIYEIITYNINL